MNLRRRTRLCVKTAICNGDNVFAPDYTGKAFGPLSNQFGVFHQNR